MKRDVSTILRWPLWSWRNLSISAAVVLVLLYGLGQLVEPAKVTLPKVSAPLMTVSPAAPLSSVSPVVSPSITPAAVPSAAVPSATAPTSAVPASGVNESVTRLATAFAQAWSSSSRSQQDWTRGIRPFVTPALAAGLAQTDPARVPATKVTGEAMLLKASVTSAQVRVPTDGGGIVVTLTRAAQGPWQVSNVAPVDQPPGATTPDLKPAASPAQG